MREHELKTTFLVAENPEELPEIEQELMARAKAALSQSYSPYSHFKVGAAALLQNGEIVSSSNYENAAYPLTVCAEHSALIQAANAYPGSPVVKLAITVKNPEKLIDKPALPCGACRQVIRETEMKNGQPIKIILQGEEGPIYIFENGNEILPLAFGGEYL